MSYAEDIDALAQEIRRMGGEHMFGAGALAELLMPFVEGMVKRKAADELDRLHLIIEDKNRMAKALSQLRWAASELDRGNRIRQFDEFEEEAISLLEKHGPIA